MIVQDAKTLKILRDAGKIHCEIIDGLMRSGLLVPGHTGIQVEEWIKKAQKIHGVESAFLGQYGYPANIILSVNDVVVHGVPMDIPFEAGDVLKVDYGIRYQGYLTDAATTLILGKPSDSRHQKCINAAREALRLGLAQARSGNTTGDIGYVIQKYVEEAGFHIIRELTGHGLGTKIHEKPDIYNYGKQGKGDILKKGMYVAIEPIVGFSTRKIFDTGKFAICMDDGGIGVQEEHCGIVGDDGFEIIA
ncbi:MAG: type I methionyl aminopeptidase [Candidatus Gracilibacteria bacterium]